MANTYTPTYNLIKPEVGSDTNQWGTHLNTDIDTIDSHMVSRILTTSQNVAGPLVFANTLTASAAVTFSNTINVSGLSTLGAVTCGGAAVFSSTVNMSGSTTISTLAVTGTATIASNGLNVGSGQLNVTGGNVSMSGNVSVSGTATVTGASTFNGVTTVNAATSITSTLAVTGATSLTGNLSVISGTAERTITVGSSGGYFFGNASNAGWKDSVGNSRVYWDLSGNLTASGNVTAYSDARLKTDVETISNAVDTVEKMRGVRFKMIEDGRPGIGVIAQEMQRAVPELVHSSDGMMSVAYGNISAVLIEAVKELSERVRQLEGQK